VFAQRAATGYLCKRPRAPYRKGQRRCVKAALSGVLRWHPGTRRINATSGKAVADQTSPKGRNWRFAPQDHQGREAANLSITFGVGTNRRERIKRRWRFGFGLSTPTFVTPTALLSIISSRATNCSSSGFSRGAFTARQHRGVFVRKTAASCGARRPDRLDEGLRASTATAAVRPHPRSIEATLFQTVHTLMSRGSTSSVCGTPWAALGYSAQTGGRLVNFSETAGWQFHDTNLAGHRRCGLPSPWRSMNGGGPFRPTLWTPQPDAPEKSRQFEQVVIDRCALRRRRWLP